MSDSMEVAVIGGGVMGLSTAWELARRGLKPVVFDRFARGHHQGASHGATRNFNNAYDEEHYLDLLVRAREGWNALGQVDGEPLLRLHGLVTHGDVDVAVIERRLIDRGIHAETLTAGEASSRWSGMRFGDDVLFSRDAGVARASAALGELERRIVAAGGEVRWETPVAHRGDRRGRRHHAVRRADAGRRRRRHGRRLDRADAARHPPASAGGHRGVPRALPPQRGRRVAVVQSLRRPRPPPGDGLRHADARRGRQGRLPPRGRRRRPRCPSARGHARGALADYVREWMPGLDPASAVPVSCTYTSTDDSAFVLDRRGRIVVGAGFSGHGFKFAPGVGATLADLALDPTALAAAPFRLS
ncbi:sarcosine oxidase [Microbacterium foliorum]|uniref:Sarcosine oxidase n=1 Tax=Microbacterium foliorum TaxID=104336 RepID=A0ABU1HM12_9MICO|nr:FAD-dependent oxidoreductase [Microbacterium foliorum]MDR6140663.1 sarcosine oxidase [Microbacterium foliorum]